MDRQQLDEAGIESYNIVEHSNSWSVKVTLKDGRKDTASFIKENYKSQRVLTNAVHRWLLAVAKQPTV